MQAGPQLSGIKKIWFSIQDHCENAMQCQLSTYRSVDLLVKVCFLQFERSAIVLYLGVGVVLDVHGRLLALRLFDSSISISL